MAVAYEGFSIREYASKMRTQNPPKSWPFGNDATKEQIESILPPITVRKFRWWFHELEEAQRSDHGHDDDDNDNDACGQDVAKTELPPPSSDDHHQIKQSARAKSKSKAPKKRSIVEIFAVAPQIEPTVAVKYLGEASSSRNPNPLIKRINKKKIQLDKSQNIPVFVDNTKKKLKKKKKKKIARNALPAIIEEDAFNLKAKDAIETGNSNSTCDGMQASSTSNGNLCRKKLQIKSSSHKKHGEIVPSKFNERKNKPGVPVRGILKKQGKLLLNDSESQNELLLEKHVKFSESVAEQASKNNLLMNIQRTDEPARYAGVDHKLAETDEEFSFVEVSSSDDEGPICIGRENQVQAVIEKEHVSDIEDPDNYDRYACPHTSRNIHMTASSSAAQVSKRCEDCHISIKGKTVVIDDSASMENSRFLSPIRASQGTYTNIQMSGSSRGFNIVGPNHAVCGISTSRSPRIFSQPTPYRPFVNENPNGSFPFQTCTPSGNTSSRPLIYPELCSQRPMSLIDGPFKIPDQWSPRPCSFTEECVYRNMCGLPLNSRGELIHLNSASSSGFVLNQLNSSGMMLGSSGSFSRENLAHPRYVEYDLQFKERYTERSHPKDLDLFPMHNSETRGTSADVFWQDPDRHVGPSHMLNTDLNLVNASFSLTGGCGYEARQNRKGMNEAFLPKENEDRVSPDGAPMTMRLMGKDVAVCRSSARGTKDDNIWMDKEIIAEHHPPMDRFPNASSLRRPRGPVSLSFEPQINLQFESVGKAPESLLLNPYINRQPDSVPRREKVPFRRSSNVERRPSSPMSFSFTNLAEPLVTGPQLALPSLPRGSSPYVQWFHEPYYRPNPPHPRGSGYDLPFLPRDCGEYLQQGSLFHIPPKDDIPPWLLHPSDRGRSLSTAYSLPSPDGILGSHPYQIPPNRYNSSMMLTTYGHLDPVSYLRSPSGPSPPAFRPQLLEAVPGIEAVSTENLNYSNRMYSRDRMKSPAFGVRTPDLCTKTKKRPAANPVPLGKANKMPNLGILKHPGIEISLASERFCSSQVEQGGRGTIGFHPDQKGAPVDSQTTLSGPEKLKAKETAQPGPTKQTTGTRHILKPGQVADLENSRPAMVPFSGFPDFVMAPESQSKSTSIYKI